MTGSRPGDRIEHGSVVPPDLRAVVAARHLAVVTQPGVVAERGDHHPASGGPEDLAHLYPCRGLLEAGKIILHHHERVGDGCADGPVSAGSAAVAR